MTNLQARATRFVDGFCTLAAWVILIGSTLDAVAVLMQPPVAWRQIAVDAAFVVGAAAWLNSGTVARWVGARIADAVFGRVPGGRR